MKINEDTQQQDAASAAGSITINDPDLAAKMAIETGKMSAIDQKINIYNQKIGLEVKKKAIIVKNVVQIQKANAKMLKDKASEQNAVNKEADAQNQQTVEVPVAQPQTSESIVVSDRTNKDRIDLLEDMIVVMELKEIIDEELTNEITDTIKYLKEEEERVSHYGGKPDMRNWYEKPEAQRDYEPPKKRRPMSDEARWKKEDKIQSEIGDLEEDIASLQYDIKSEMEPFSSPDFEGVDGEIEQFFGSLPFEQSDILNSGAFSTDKEKIKALEKAGAEDGEGILQNYYYYYPEFDPSLDEKRAHAEIEVKKIQAEIEKLEKKIEEKNQQMNSLYDSDNPMSPENFYDLSEAYVEQEKKTKEDYIDDDYLFYIKAFEGDDWFIGKIFKVSPDGDWYGIVKAGENDTFEKISYEPEQTEMDIVEFLRDNYDSIEIIDRHEYNDYVEDKPGDEPIDEEGGVSGMHI